MSTSRSLARPPAMLPFPHGPPIFSWPAEGVFLDRGQPLGDINEMGFTGVGRTIGEGECV
jgi:hypothetical protein